MINILIGIFYVALILLFSYLFYYIIKIAIKDAYYELEYKDMSNDSDYTYENTDIEDEDNK